MAACVLKIRHATINGVTIKFWEWISYFTPLYTGYTSDDVAMLWLKLNYVSKRDQLCERDTDSSNLKLKHTIPSWQ